MISGWEKYTGRKPEFEQGLDFTKVTFNLKETTQKTAQKTTQKTTQKTSERILELIRQTPSISRKDLAEALGDITESGVKYQLESLKKQYKIKRIGGDKGGRWEVKVD
jgi:ATP-dependent DNA helicase RecG